MLHRHLDAPGYTLAAIDDVIERGKLDDWLDLAQALRDDPVVRAKARHIVAARTGYQSTIHHEFWRSRLSYLDECDAKQAPLGNRHARF